MALVSTQCIIYVNLAPSNTYSEHFCVSNMLIWPSYSRLIVTLEVKYLDLALIYDNVTQHSQTALQLNIVICSWMPGVLFPKVNLFVHTVAQQTPEKIDVFLWYRAFHISMAAWFHSQILSSHLTYSLTPHTKHTTLAYQL